ncbi:hypothetical protein MPER_07285 [Moniliophthora perniciosa FA553]|nr:hypothetical protein MPER_07285 [Moniliophthora perniciosa FA553]
MFFGLTNSPATFQAFIDNGLVQLHQDSGWIYMDDILVFSQNREEHKEQSCWLLQWLADHDLFLKPEKCEFNITEVIFLRMVICPGQIVMDLAKLTGICNWLLPDSVTGVCLCLGFGNFYW